MVDRFEKCVIHIGTEKTGSTSLQTFLGQNRGRLVAKGFFVPSSLSPYKHLANHERLTTVALADAKLSDDVRVGAGVVSAEALVRHRTVARSELASEITSNSPKCRTMIVSNEHCHSRLVSIAEVERLRDFLRDFAETFEIVVYLRPQHELAVSLYDQAMKAGYADIEVLPPFKPGAASWVEKPYFDYDALLGRWGQVFGKDNITVRLFHRAELRDGNVITDFMHVVGADLQGMVFPEDKNTSIAAEFQPAMNALNRFGRHHKGRVTAAARSKLISALQNRSRGPGKLPSRSDAETFFELFSSTNEAVRQRFFPDRSVLFNVDFDGYPTDAHVGRSEADALVDVLLGVMGS